MIIIDADLELTHKADQSTAKIAAAHGEVGMASSAHAMLIMVFLDPKSTTKFGPLILSGTRFALTGGISATQFLAEKKPPKLKATRNGFEIG